MNLDKFKKDVDMEDVTKAEINNLKKIAIEKFNEFFDVMGKSSTLWNDKMKKTVDEFIRDFINYMKKNGFDVDRAIPHITENDCIRINATYHDRNIYLDALNYNGENMYLMVGDVCAAEFWFDLPKGAPRYRYWKDNITVSGKSTHDFGEFANLAYKDFVDYYNTKEELQEVIEKVQININHFNDSIKDIDKYDYYVNKFGAEETYNGFQEFIDSVEI